jgi:hypothetical protein
VNPEHLFTGTNLDNVADKMSKNRQAKGERNHSKLTAEKVKEMRDTYAAGGISFATLGQQFGIGHTQAEKIVKRVKWKHVE